MVTGPVSMIFIGVEIGNIAASVFFNLLLLYLIIIRSSREIGSYRYLLLAFTLNNIYYPIVHLLTLPVICTYTDSFIMFSRGILTSRFSISLFASSHSQSMPLLAHLFMYRLIATKWPSCLRLYTKRTCCLLVPLTVGTEGILWFANCYFGYGSDQETRDLIQPLLDVDFDGDGKDFIGALYYSVDGTPRTGSILATMGLNAMMLCFMSIIVFASITIVMHYRLKHIEISDKTRKMQQQLFYTLIAQMIFPLLFVYLPCAATINLPMLGVHLYLQPNLASASLSVFPFVDALIIMFGVRTYRQVIYIWLKCGSHKNIVTSVNDSVNQKSWIATSPHH